MSTPTRATSSHLRPDRVRCAGSVSPRTIKVVALSAAIVVIITYFFLIPFFSGDATPPQVVELGYQCTKCDHVFTMTNKEFQARKVDYEFIRKTKDRTNDMTDCPKCGEKHIALQMTRCPSCSKFYLPAKVNLRSPPKDYVPPEPVCPHCGTNLNQWHREHND